MNEHVTIATPTMEGMPYPSEGLRAVPRDPAAGLYEVLSVAFFTDGVSRGDIVRCESDGEDRLVAVEVVERSGGVTLLLVPADDDGTDDRVPRLAGDLQDRLGQRLAAESGMGVLTVAFDRAVELAVLGTIANHGAGDGTVDPAEQRVGEWYFHTVAHPDWPAPQRLTGTGELHAATLDLEAFDWPGADALVAGWPSELVEHLRDAAATDLRLRAALDDRRYLAAVAPALRRRLAAEVGMDLVGHQPFPLHPASGDPEEVAFEDDAFELEWAVAAATDAGVVQWCEDPDVDRRFRAELVSLGLDPDADPRQPIRD